MNKMNLATKITMVRIIMIPIVMALYIMGYYIATDTPNASNGAMSVNMAIIIVSAILYSIAAFTDFLDGNIARRTNTVTTLGKFLDPIADKCLIVVMLVLLVGYDVMPEPYASVFVGLIFAREFIISALRQIAVSKGFVLSADKWGKIKTVFTDFAVGFLIVAPLHEVLYWIGGILFLISVALTFYSGLNYLIKNRAVFRDDYVAPQEEAAAGGSLESSANNVVTAEAVISASDADTALNTSDVSEATTATASDVVTADETADDAKKKS